MVPSARHSEDERMEIHEKGLNLPSRARAGARELRFGAYAGRLGLDLGLVAGNVSPHPASLGRAPYPSKAATQLNTTT